MAVMTLDFYSRELKMSTLLTVVLPDSTRIGDIPLSRRRCLYLLHGLSDDSTAALRLSRVELFARDAGIVVVMPSAGRSMYCDGVLGQNYLTHITHELPEYLGLVLGLSQKRAQNYIAGISMGGMGAARAALTYPGHYAAVALFSGLLDVGMLLPHVNEAQRAEFPFMLDAGDSMDTSPLNPINLLDGEKHRGLPMLIRCGLRDDLLPMSRAFYQKARNLGLDIRGSFEDGQHEWRLWDRYLDDFIAEMADTPHG